jgi:hypothetical protein
MITGSKQQGAPSRSAQSSQCIRSHYGGTLHVFLFCSCGLNKDERRNKKSPHLRAF